MFVYHTAPIDFWAGAPDVLTYVNSLKRFNSVRELIDDMEGFMKVPAETEDCSQAEEIVELLRQALSLAKDIGWEGDFRAPPHICFVPYPDEACFKKIFVWKQDNNGSTFIASEIPLPWLNDA